MLGYHPSSTAADTGADRLHQLCCKGDGSIIISGTLYWGRDDAFKRVNSLEEAVSHQGKEERDVICFPLLLPPGFIAASSVLLHRLLF